MATYSYKCPTCQAESTKMHSINEDPTYQCENCKVDLIKVFSSPPISFKGGGWAHKE